jgi:AraC-like DNA-binding protein
MNASKREKRSHGTVGFPFQIYPRGPKDNLFVPYHWHPELEIITVISGEVGITIGENQYVGQTGDIFFVDLEQLHEIRGGQDGLFRAYVFPLDSLQFQRTDLAQSELLAPLAARELKFRTELRCGEPGGAGIREAFGMIERACAAKGMGYQLMVKAALLQIVAIAAANGLLEHRMVRQTSDYRAQTLKSIVEYLNEHFTEQIRLGEVAAKFGLSPQYFCTFFKDNLGKTLVQHVNFLRIEKASGLLRETDMPIMDIAFSVGFENFSYFIKRFREVFGCTPSQYRKNLSRLSG